MTENAPQKQQNTHFYRTGGSDSFTADPTQADPGEVQRVGLHECEKLGCEYAHACSAEAYGLWLLWKQFGGDAGVAEGGRRA